MPPLLDSLAAYVVAHPEQSLTLAVGVLGALGHYQRTGSLPLGRLPWKYGRELAGDLGDKYFGAPRPSGVPGLVVDAPPSEVMDGLVSRHYEDSDLVSYEYEDEAFGVRRPSGERSDPETGEAISMETHPRGFQTADGQTLLLTHDEAARYNETGRHLRGELLSWTRGRDIVAEDLDALELDYERVPSEAESGVEVVSPPEDLR